MASVPELQQKLYKRMGLDAPEPSQPRNPRQGRRPGHQPSRKDQRKAQRVQKRTHIYTRPTQPARTAFRVHSQPRQNGAQVTKPAQHQHKAPKPSHQDENGDDDDDDDEMDEDDDEFNGTDISLGESEDESEPDERDGDDDDNDGDAGSESRKTKGLSRAAQERLAQDDAEIEQFERKLGIKKGRKSLPQSFKEDGLEELMGDLGGKSDQSDEETETSKGKHEYDDWLAAKRRKTAQASKETNNQGESDEDDDVNMLDENDDSEMDDFGDESFEGFDSDTSNKTPSKPRQRENPYVAPTAGVTVAKYVPPSLRKAAGTEEEHKSRLRKQVQGLINRLTDGNILSIVQSIEELYQKNARGDVTDIITDSIMAQICKPESLPDQFFVLTGGFAAAIYRIIGSSFGSHLLRRVVTDFGEQYEQAKDIGDHSAIQKEASHLLTFISQLYVFDVATCKIVFDYMERLLSDLTEINVELLLRICRMAGRLLRRDDPHTLKHVSGVLNQSVSKIGLANVSVRTKFMVEMITDLKNSKPKARGLDSVVVSEHVQRMKKRLGELKTQSRRLDGLAPMGVGLTDIEGADTKGKWWLVGASVPVKAKKANGKQDTEKTKDDDSTDNEDMDIVLPDYPKKARAQGLSGTVQVAIFSALMSATDFEHGYRQFINLRLKKDDQLEIARVLIQCVGSEVQYNPYYALVGGQACANSRVRFALQDRLWRIFRGLGESLFGEGPEDEETADGERMKDERRVGNVARFYAALIADGALTIAILKPLELPEANTWTSMFVQRLIIALLHKCRNKGASEDVKVEKIFGPARELPGLAAGIHWMLRKRIRKTKLVGAKELKKLERVREKAQAAVQAVAAEVYAV
ncbi:suppressor of glycerol defect [Neonectria magnoliae]|uniref:Suppressor of glycerol defect n=1 Tax=Neonectria magnoliae TaxID=2732573 RepID=A0ABR1I540_9HYPO